MFTNPTIHGLFGENTVEDVRIGAPMMRKNKFGQSRLVVYELPNFKEEKWTKVSFSVPTDNSESVGGSKQYVFSNGSQVLDQKLFNQANRKRKW
jgi:hypothetical protein